MGRPRQPIGTYGKIRKVQLDSGVWQARTRYRFDDGVLRLVERNASSSAKAENALKKALTEIRASSRSEVKREMRMKELAERFLETKADLGTETLKNYTHAARVTISGQIGDLAISEATTERLQKLLDAVGKDKGAGAARMARAVLSGMMGLAVRSGAITVNPVREVAAITGKAN